MTHWNLWVPANQTLKRQTGEWVGLLWSQVLCSKGDGAYIAMYTGVLKRHQKAGYRHTNSIMHVLHTYHQNDHNTVAEGKESQIKALSKLETKHTKITVVVSPEERDRGPWTASLTFSDVTRFHSKWLHQVERKRALHWQVFQVRYSLIGMKTSERAFLFLAWVGCQKECWLPASLRRARLDPFTEHVDDRTAAQESGSWSRTTVFTTFVCMCVW